MAKWLSRTSSLGDAVAGLSRVVGIDLLPALGHAGRGKTVAQQAAADAPAPPVEPPPPRAAAAPSCPSSSAPAPSCPSSSAPAPSCPSSSAPAPSCPSSSAPAPSSSAPLERAELELNQRLEQLAAELDQAEESNRENPEPKISGQPRPQLEPLTHNPRKLAYWRMQATQACTALQKANAAARAQSLERLTIPREVHALCHDISDNSDALAGALDWVRRRHGPGVALDVQAAASFSRAAAFSSTTGVAHVRGARLRYSCSC